MGKSQSAFTLVECLLALLVTSIVVALVSMTLPTAYRATHRQLGRPVDFALLLAELEDADHHFQMRAVNPHSLRVVDTHNHKEFTLKAAGRVYLTSSDGGYLELLDGIQPGSLQCQQLDQQRVFIGVRRDNGENEWGIVRLPHPKREESNDKSKAGLRATFSDHRVDHDVDSDNHAR